LSEFVTSGITKEVTGIGPLPSELVMQITRFSDYALRVLMYLAVQPERSSTIAEIAARYDISRNHLMKVVQYLGAQGYVETTRGKNGGLKLAGPAASINVGQLLRRTEEGTVLIECFGADNRCLITPACRLKQMLARALDSFYRSLEDYTLEDLVGGSSRHELELILLR
jgi:Rrf2 family nitric oxide-sensitive transcriptional repressor